MTADFMDRQTDTAMHITRYILLVRVRMAMSGDGMLVVECLDASDGLANDECWALKSAWRRWLRCAKLISLKLTVDILSRRTHQHSFREARQTHMCPFIRVCYLKIHDMPPNVIPFVRP